MTKRDQQIARLYTAKRLSLGEVGEQFGLSKERVRQILIEQGITDRHSESERGRKLKEETKIAHERVLTGEGTVKTEADHLCITPSALQKRFWILGLRTPRQEAEHGTRSRYVGPHRCRCDLCRKAHATYMREFRRRRKDHVS